MRVAPTNDYQLAATNLIADRSINGAPDLNLARGSDTNENRNIDISGYCAAIVNNSAHVFKQSVATTQYQTVDGECILAQTEAPPGGLVVLGHGLNGRQTQVIKNTLEAAGCVAQLLSVALSTDMDDAGTLASHAVRQWGARPVQMAEEVAQLGWPLLARRGAMLVHCTVIAMRLLVGPRRRRARTTTLWSTVCPEGAARTYRSLCRKEGSRSSCRRSRPSSGSCRLDG
jgi:hypothetical protein